MRIKEETNWENVGHKTKNKKRQNCNGEWW